MTAVLCDNANHPSGAWHQATPLPFSWQWGKRIHQWLNRERWGCRCSRGSGGEEDGAAAQLGLVSKPVTDEGQQVLGTCSPELLTAILASYRATISTAWCAATAHHAYAGADGSPVGQCGVTAAWLQQRLREDHGIDTTYCVGMFVCPYDGDRLADHCWLEGDGWVADLTSDQISCGLPTWTTPYVISGGCYTAALRLTVDEWSADLLQRLAILTERVGS